MSEKSKTVKVIVVLPESLKEQLDYIAKADCRTVNNLITKILLDKVTGDQDDGGH